MSFAQQGNAGVGQAIAYYTSQGYTVSIPLNDTQKYDLIVDDGESLRRVQVKTTTHVKPSGFYGVTLKTSGVIEVELEFTLTIILRPKSCLYIALTEIDI